MAHKQDREPPIPAAARPAYDAIVALTDAFCRDRHNAEYGALCWKLTGVLTWRRPSPVVGMLSFCGGSRPAAWFL